MNSLNDKSSNENTQNIKVLPQYFLGVDGGGSGTRITLTDCNLHIIATKDTPFPSALSLGVKNSWSAIIQAIDELFLELNLPCNKAVIALGLGLSGANNPKWKTDFLNLNPGFIFIHLETDGMTTLLGAHQGKPGAIVALGTGSVGLKLNSDGTKKDVSGWGFPSGDEASGAWIGLKAASLTEKAIDGRVAHSNLTRDILNYCGGSPEEFLKWLGSSNQNQYAKLAPLVFNWANQGDLFAKEFIKSAVDEVILMIRALDIETSQLPLSLCGRLGEALLPFLPSSLQARHVKAYADSSFGAVLLIKNELSRVAPA